MNLFQLYYFKKVAELQHYTQAAKELYISQPALSESISLLENELGVQLFQKDGRSVKLTKYGADFFKYISLALQSLDKGIVLAKEKTHDVGGTIEVGCLLTLCGDFLPMSVRRYNETVSKETHFNIFNSPHTHIVIEGLKTGRFDVAFGSRMPDEADIAFVPLYPEKIVALVNQDHPLAGMGKIAMDDLCNYTIVTYSRPTSPANELAPLIALHNLDAHCKYKYNDEISLGGYVLFHPVVGLVAETPLFEQFPDLIHLEIVDIPRDYRYLYMAYSKSLFLSRQTERFIQFVRENREELIPHRRKMGF
jgi:DNA-binding transcriptional LysR family regulator